MSIFNNSQILRGQSFAHGLSPFDALAIDSDVFVETPRLSVLIDEEGVTNISGRVLLHEEADPIDSVSVPSFSKGNNFVEGLARVLPGVPVGGVIAYSSGAQFGVSGSLPEGFVRCDGKVYKKPGGGNWIAPVVAQGLVVGQIVWIVRLPEGAVATGGKFVPNFGN